MKTKSEIIQELMTRFDFHSFWIEKQEDFTEFFAKVYYNKTQLIELNWSHFSQYWYVPLQ